MALNNEIKEQIALQVIRTLYNQFEKFPEDIDHNRNAPFHEAFLNAFADKLQNKVESAPVLISLSSWLHGLNTSLGQSFFENVAQFLCNGEKKEFTTNKRNNLKIEKEQKQAITKIITDLSNDIISPSLSEENKIIFKIPKKNNLEDATNFTADVYYENSNEIVCIEIKTVKPNKGVFKVEKQKILEAKAALKFHHPSKDIKYFLAFPFDPLSDDPCGSNKQRFMEYSVGFTKYFDKEEILLASEFWDYLSGNSKTMDEILKIINNIATPEFLNELNFLCDNNNREMKQEKYLKLLEKWFLYQEKMLLENIHLVKKKLKTRTLENLYNQSCFREGEYKLTRIQNLLKL